MSDNLKPWERNASETDEQWAAFRNYRDMLPPRRVISAAARDTSSLWTWSREQDWHKRAIAYDRHIDSVRLAERESILKTSEAERTARQLAILLDAQDLAGGELRKLLAAAAQNQGAGLIRPADVVKLMQLAVTASRLIRGEATERIAVQDLSKLSDEELEKLAELEEKAKVSE